MIIIETSKTEIMLFINMTTFQGLILLNMGYLFKEQQFILE